MDTLLLFFAIPVAIIILSIVLQKILRCPILVAATFFAILLIVAFAAFDSSFLILVIIYTILAYITAVLTRLVCNLIARFADCFDNDDGCVCGNNNGNSRRGRNGNCCNNNGNVRRGNNDCNNNEQGATFTLTSSQAEPVLFLTNRNSNPNCNNWNIRNGISNTNNNCCCRRR